MRKGEAFIGFSVPVSQPAAALPYAAMASPPVEVPVEILVWRERTGRVRGILFKSPEVKTIRVRGLRCVSCGYLELYAVDGREALRTLYESREAVSI